MRAWPKKHCTWRKYRVLISLHHAFLTLDATKSYRLGIFLLLLIAFYLIHQSPKAKKKATLFLRSLFLHCNSVSTFEVPTVSVLHLSTLFFAYLRGVHHSKSAHQALSITVSQKVGWQHKTASRYHCGTSLVPLFTTFHHISPAGCKNPLCVFLR